MKKLHKILALLMAGVLVFALAACGSSDSTESDSGESESASAPAGDEQESESPAADDGSEEGASGDAEFTTVEAGKLHMSTNASFPPYEMTTDDGGFTGIDVDIATKIAEKLGLELVVDDMDFTAALTAAQNGQSDIVMAGVTVNEDRLKVLDFTDSYATGVQVVIVAEGSDVTLDNMGEKLIGCQKGTTGYVYASDTPENGGYGEDHVIAYDNGAMAVEALKGGQVDCVLIDNEPAKAYVAANEGLTILDGDWLTENYAIGVQKGNTALLDAVNGALDELMEDGTVQSIIDSYINAD